MASARDEQAGAMVIALVDLMRAGRALAIRAGTERRATSTPTAVLKAVTNGHTRPSDIAAELQIDLSVVSRAIGVLHGEGLIARTPDPNDARAQVLSVTDAGRQRIEDLRRVYVQVATELLSEWTPEEIEEATGILARLSESLRGDFADDLPERLIRASDAVAASGPTRSTDNTGATPTATERTTTERTATERTATEDTGDERQRRRSLATA